MKKILLTSIACLTFSMPVFAHENPYEANNWWLPKISMGAYGGYGTINGAYGNDGQYAQGRLNLGFSMWNYNCIGFGLELGVQSGNDERLYATNDVITITGGLPVQATLKPLVDLLLTVKGQFLPGVPVVGILKGGIAFRQLQLMDRNSSHDNLRKVNGEFQAGLGVNISRHAMLTTLYQGIYNNGNASVSVNGVGDTTIGRIPTQQAGLLGVEWSY